jgi:hypothetical protein
MPVKTREAKKKDDAKKRRIIEKKKRDESAKKRIAEKVIKIEISFRKKIRFIKGPGVYSLLLNNSRDKSIKILREELISQLRKISAEQIKLISNNPSGIGQKGLEKTLRKLIKKNVDMSQPLLPYFFMDNKLAGLYKEFNDLVNKLEANDTETRQAKQTLLDMIPRKYLPKRGGTRRKNRRTKRRTRRR